MTQEPILITGVGKRLGLHLARSFLARGIPVIGTYRTDREGLTKLRHEGAELHACDFDDEVQLLSLVANVTTRHARLRAVIHNASDWLADSGELAPSAVIQRMMQVHAVTPYLLNLALEPLLRASENAHADIIHIGDYVSGRGSSKHIAYAASKAAQDNLTLSFAAKLAPKIKVNSISPALVLFNSTDSAEYRAKALDKSLMRCEAGLDEFQHSIDYLLGSSYVTGRILPLDGGRRLV